MFRLYEPMWCDTKNARYTEETKAVLEIFFEKDLPNIKIERQERLYCLNLKRRSIVKGYLNM